MLFLSFCTKEHAALNKSRTKDPPPAEVISIVLRCKDKNQPSIAGAATFFHRKEVGVSPLPVCKGARDCVRNFKKQGVTPLSPVMYPDSLASVLL